MDVLTNMLIASGLISLKELGESMKQSKTLTIMVVIGVLSLVGLVWFLYVMAGKQ